MNEKYEKQFEIVSGDFVSAGQISRDIKSILNQLGVNPSIIRKIAVATYEAEMNLVIHSLGGTMHMTYEPDRVIIIAKDTGPGIEDIVMAMSQGYSTATEQIREMGFGAGMGLPNMKANADGFQIKSKLGKGTTVTMSFNI